MRFNINNHVRVRLTDAGRAIHREWTDNLYSSMPAAKREYQYTPPIEDSDGWSTWQMWNLMQIFGSSCGLSSELPFQTVIEFEIDCNDQH